MDSVHATGPGHLGVDGRGILALVSEERLRRILSRMLDEEEFLSPYGLRALSRHHRDHPYVFHVGGQEFRVELPAGRVRFRHVRRQLELARADLDAGERARHPRAVAVLPVLRRQLQGRMSDRFGPVDEPVRGEQEHHRAAGAHLPARRDGTPRRVRRRPKSSRRIRTGATISSSTNTSTATTAQASGASHQTGWTGLVARLIQLYGALDPVQLLAAGKSGAFRKPAGSPPP